MKIYIRSMAFSQTHIAQNLYAKMNITIEHLLYIVLDPNSPTVHHWCSEICAFIGEVDKLSSTKKFPSEKQIYEWTYGRKQDLVTDEAYMNKLIKRTAKKENLTVVNTTSEISEKLDYVCTKYFHWLAKELSTVGIVDEDEVEEKIRQFVAEIQ